MSRRQQLPELYAGIKREPGTFPVQYLGANVPQAWAAGSVFHLLQAILGLDADAHKKSLYIDPELPHWLPDITLHNLHVGESTITLRFWKENKETRHEVLALEGDLLVQRHRSPGNLPNEGAQLTHNGRFQDHRERGLASGLV